MRIPWEPMNAIFAGRGQVATTGVAAGLGLGGMAPSVCRGPHRRAVGVRGPSRRTCAVPPPGTGVHPGHEILSTLRRPCAARTPTTPMDLRSTSRPPPVCVSRTPTTLRSGNLASQARAAMARTLRARPGRRWHEPCVPGPGGDAMNRRRCPPRTRAPATHQGPACMPRMESRGRCADRAPHAGRRCLGPESRDKAAVRLRGTHAHDNAARNPCAPRKRRPSSLRERKRPRREHHRGRLRDCESS